MNCKKQNKPQKNQKKNRRDCKYRHENGNCLVVGGFCPSVHDRYCIKA